MANIYNTKSNTLLSGTSGNDTIQNGGYDKKGKWRDGGSNVTIDAGKGNDYIFNLGFNLGKNVVINAGAGNDSIDNRGGYATINLGAGRDTIDNLSANVTINAGAGNDSIQNASYSENVKIDAGAGNDTIRNGGGRYATISAGAGNDYIYNTGANAIITAGAGNDSILSSAANGTINGGMGNDHIGLSSYKLDDKSSIDFSYAGASNVIQYAAGGGNDTVVGFNYDDTLQITEGTYTTEKSGDDFIVKIGEDSIVLKNVGDFQKVTVIDSAGEVTVYNDLKVKSGSGINFSAKVTLSGSSDADSIRNHGKNVTITSGEGNDTIYNKTSYGSAKNIIYADAGDDSVGNDFSNKVTIDGGAGNDTISNYHSRYSKLFGGDGDDKIYNDDDSYNVTIDAGAGNDEIYNNFGDSVSITGGTGNDSIYNRSSNVTINAGADNDFISLNSWASNNVIQYAAGDGNDTIRGFNADDTLQITSGEYSAELSGKDVIVTVGDGSITFKNAKNKNITIIDENGESNIFNSGSSANLSELVAEKSVAEFENYKSESKQENLITFAK